MWAACEGAWDLDEGCGGQQVRDIGTAEGSQIEMKSRISLLQAVKEEDAALRQIVLNFWLERFQNLTLPQRILHILQKVYSPESEESFLQLAMYVLLEATRRSADYQRDIFQQPLTLCKFREMKVSTAWRARHASMIPLFMETQGSNDSSLRSLTQGSDMEDDFEGLGGVEATQANVFSATQQPGGTYNWMTESTFDTSLADMEYAASHAPTQGSSTGVLFNVGTSGKKDLQRYKTLGTGNARMQPPETDTTDSGSLESKLIRKRFVKDQDREKQSIYFAKIEERRTKMRATIEKERKSRREAQVTMYRQYRVGELPDVQIPHRALIAPLQALSQRDGKVAQLLFDVVVQGVIDNTENLMSLGEKDSWVQQLKESVNMVLASSCTCHPDLLRSILHLVINNDISVDPEALVAACLGGQLEALGILVLERQSLLSHKGESRALPPARKKQRTEMREPLPDSAIWINIAELYKSLNMWDVVRGIVHSKLGSIKPETKEALEAEATNNCVQAFLLYRSALNTTHWDEEPQPAEVRLWEEWYGSCAEMLGQWSQLERFVEDRFLRDEAGQVGLNQVWNLPRPAASVLPSLVHSKLMSVLDGAKSDGNLFKFLDSALLEPSHRVLLENTLPLQLAIVSTHQLKIAQAQYYTTTATSNALLTLAQYSLLTPKPLTNTLRDIQLITELGEFLKTYKYAENEYYPSKVKQTVTTWKNQEASITASSVMMQFQASYRELYLHFLEKELPPECPQDIPQLIKDAKASLQKSVIRAALLNRNYHLANRHLKKLKPLSEDDRSLAQFYFFMIETNIHRGRSNPNSRLQYLVEAWAKNLGKVNEMPVLKEDARIEVEYLKLESSLCMEISEAIKGMGNDWQENNEYMKSLATRFPSAKRRSGWYEELLKCSYNSLKLAVKCAEDNLLQQSNAVKGAQNPSNDILMTLAKYCEECLEKWNETIEPSDYAKSLVIAILRAMALGSREAHFHFPRLINLMDDDANLVATFTKEVERVPVWMFLLWINHILIYIDKHPGPALQPIVEKLAVEYPQAVVYPFRISMQQYNFTGKDGKAAEAMCTKVESLISKFSLLDHFVTATSQLVVPFVACRDSFDDLLLEENKNEIELGLKNVVNNYLRVDNRFTKGTPGEKGEAYCKVDRLRKNADVAMTKEFGGNLSKLKTMSVKEIKRILYDLRNIIKPNLKDEKDIPKQMKAYSPWLATFQASKHSEVLEIPGQYSGLSKPLPSYHIKIASFDENILPMRSLHVPLRMVIRGSDERDHKFLVKCGEDLRTDQRVQQAFTMMNSVYSSSPLCAHTSFQLSLDTYQIIPLSSKVGLVQWVESTQPLKDFMNHSFTDAEAKCYDEAQAFYSKGQQWVITKKLDRKFIVKRYEETVNKIPWDTLRRGLVKLSSSNEGFFSLRSVFASSYATLCISHWVLGIGDRHCGNTLVCLKTGRVVGIDFGHHFETSVQFIGVPELMPFRLTPQITNVFQPLGHTGMLRDVMVAALEALRESRHVILALLEAFIKEPTKDWLKFVRKQEGSLEESKVEMFSKERIMCLKEKLNGIHPSHITVWAVSKNSQVKNSDALENLKKAVLGMVGENMRAGIDQKGLSTHQQVDVLMEQASDPNILGRTWRGWEPFL